MIVHPGTAPQALYERWDPYDIEYVWIAWDGMLDGATISTSTWVLPTGWTLVAAQMAASVTDEDGNTYAAANGALLSTTTTSGRHTISNRTTLSDGRQYERSMIIVVREL